MRSRRSILKISLALVGLMLAFAASILLAGSSDLRRAHSAMDSGDYPAAAAHYQSAARRLFWRAELWEQAGQAALYAGRPEETIRLLAGRASLTPFGRHALGQAYIRTGDLDQALDLYESLLADQGASVEAYTGLAMVHHLNGSWIEERSAWQNLSALLPENAAAHFRLGELWMLTDSEPALEHLLLAARLDPAYDPAVQTLRTSINLSDLQPDESSRRVVAGRGLALVEEWPLAADLFRQSVEADDGNAQAWAWLGEAEQHLGRDGLEALERALDLDPDSAIVRGLRGLYWKRAGNFQSALVEYQAAAALEPDNTAWTTALGETYAQLGDLILALTAYQRATEQVPADATNWRLLATFCVEFGVQIGEVGLPAALRAVELAPDEARAWDALGWTQFNIDLYYSAEASLQEALELDPDLASAHLHLGLTFLKQGKLDPARDHLARTVQLEPQGLYGTQAQQVLDQYFP